MAKWREEQKGLLCSELDKLKPPLKGSETSALILFSALWQDVWQVPETAIGSGEPALDPCGALPSSHPHGIPSLDPGFQWTWGFW